jgi:hypothetical protein
MEVCKEFRVWTANDFADLGGARGTGEAGIAT